MKKRAFAIFVLLAVCVCGVRGADAEAQQPQAEGGAALLNEGEVYRLQNGSVRQMTDWVLDVFGVEDANLVGNGMWHYVIAAGFVVVFCLARRRLVPLVFRGLRAAAKRTETHLDDRIYGGLEQPAGVFIVLLGVFAATRVLFFPEVVDGVILVAAKFAFLLTFAWALFRMLNAVLDFWTVRAAEKKKREVQAFMPWIKRAIGVLFVIIATLLIAQSFGFEVKTFLAGLGLGGLAFALAAQDTLANLFGAVVVAIDQPFRVGDSVQIGSVKGSVEDIGLRSTKLRTPERTLVIVPNKTVSTEVINNFTKMPQRRVDQMIGLTYETTPEQMEAILGDIREILGNDSGVSQDFLVVNFTGYGASSLDIQVTFFTANPDFRQHLVVRERINLAIMRAVAARGLSFAFPSRTVYLDGQVARKLAGEE